jgi:hypothetical protein
MSVLRRVLRQERGQASARVHASKVRTMQALDRREPDLLFRAMVTSPFIIRVPEPEPPFWFRQYVFMPPRLDWRHAILVNA